MASHEATCPACGSTLLVHVFPHVGGSVEESVGVTLALSEEEQTAQRLLAAKAAADERAARAAAEATDAAKAVLAAAQQRQKTTEAAAKVNADKVAAAKAALKGGADA
jgi:anti-sigma28 factor (negative regulator of flagellin synthesis)